IIGADIAAAAFPAVSRLCSCALTSCIYVVVRSFIIEARLRVLKRMGVIKSDSSVVRGERRHTRGKKWGPRKAGKSETYRKAGRRAAGSERQDYLSGRESYVQRAAEPRGVNTRDRLIAFSRSQS